MVKVINNKYNCFDIISVLSCYEREIESNSMEKIL